MKKLAEIEHCRAEAEAEYKDFSRRDRDLFALGLYAGEGAQSGNHVSMANTNPAYLGAFVA